MSPQCASGIVCGYVELARGFRHVAREPLIRSSHHDANFRPELDILEVIQADLHARDELAWVCIV